jgi:hypothetical protein
MGQTGEIGETYVDGSLGDHAVMMTPAAPPNLDGMAESAE